MTKMRFFNILQFFLENKILEMENMMNEKHNSGYSKVNPAEGTFANLKMGYLKIYRRKKN